MLMIFLFSLRRYLVLCLENFISSHRVGKGSRKIFHLPWTLTPHRTVVDGGMEKKPLRVSWVGCQGSTYSACNLFFVSQASAVRSSFPRKAHSRMYDYLFSARRSKSNKKMKSVCTHTDEYTRRWKAQATEKCWGRRRKLAEKRRARERVKGKMLEPLV